MSTKKNARNRCGFWRFAGKRYKLSAWRTEVRDGRPSDRTSCAHLAETLVFATTCGFDE